MPCKVDEDNAVSIKITAPSPAEGKARGRFHFIEIDDDAPSIIEESEDSFMEQLNVKTLQTVEK